MMFHEIPKPEQEPIEIKNLGDFDLDYFKQLEGEKGWLALGSSDYTNQQYFTVFGDNGEKLGIVGVFDTEDEKNTAHTVVDQKYRGRGLATQFKNKLIEKLNLPYLTLTVDTDNNSSIRAIEKLPEVEKISDEEYEKEYHKLKYIYKRREEEK